VAANIPAATVLYLISEINMRKSIKRGVYLTDYFPGLELQWDELENEYHYLSGTSLL